MLENDDAEALVEAVLESPEPTLAKIVSELRHESGLDLRTSFMYARVVLRRLMDKGNKQATIMVQGFGDQQR